MNQAKYDPHEKMKAEVAAAVMQQRQSNQFPTAPFNEGCAGMGGSLASAASEQTGEVSERIERNGKLQYQLLEVLNRLRSRLDPILRPCDTKGTEPGREPSITKVGSALSENCLVTRMGIDLVLDIMERLEL